MNHIYRIVWNQTKACWQAVCETANGHPRGTSSRRASGTSRNAASVRPRTQLKLSHAALLCGFGLMTATVGAAPTGGQVSAGTATISQSGATTTIQQASQKAAIDWTGFSVGKTESVRFNQPNASAITLNRVTGTERSEILGSLSANGQVFILNPNGVLFGKGAQVNVGGIVASTLRMSNEDFMAGNFRLTEGPNARASVSNEGEIRVAEGGVLALIAPVVTNTGTLAATQGSVLMAAADAVSVTLQDGSLVSYTLDKGNLQALVDNGGIIQAEGGHVVLTAKGLDALSKAVVNHSGVIEAQTVSTKNGVVELLGDMELGQVNLSGRVDASEGSGLSGGKVETSAANVTVFDSALVSTSSALGYGDWSIRSRSPTVAQSGFSENSSIISATSLSKSLSNGNVSIFAVGNSPNSLDININQSVSWAADTRLSLEAQRNININSNLALSGDHAGLSMVYGYTHRDVHYYGGSRLRTVGGEIRYSNGATVSLTGESPFFAKGSPGIVQPYTVINKLGSEADVGVSTLQGINGNGWGYYVLGADIDASATATWNGGKGFAPIVPALVNYYYYEPLTKTTPFVFDGLGHSIRNIYINRPDESKVGLFGRLDVGRVENLKVTGIVSGLDSVGLIAGVVGHSDGCMYYCGASTIEMTTFEGVSAAGSVRGRDYVGGIVGSGLTLISRSSAEASVLGVTNVGGIIGAGGVLLSQSYSQGSVAGDANVGGLVGAVGPGQIDGWGAAAQISDSYSLATVAADAGPAGGLVGRSYGGLWGGTPISNTYSAGRVTGALAGGLIGQNDLDSEPVSSYWNVDTSGLSSSRGGAGLNNESMTRKANYSGWDFNGVWRIVEGSSYPILRALTQGKITLTVSAANETKVYNAQPWNPNPSDYISYAGFAVGDNSGSLSGVLRLEGAAIGAVDAGTYGYSGAGLSSQKYEISYLPGYLTITPSPISVSGARPYDASNKAYAESVTSLNGVFERDKGLVSVTAGSGVLSGVNVGEWALSSLDTLTLGGQAAGNYRLVASESKWAISPRPLIIVPFDATKTYGDPDPKLSYVIAGGGLLGNDILAGELGRAPGENAGSYAINKGSLVAGSNYSIQINEPLSHLLINQRPLSLIGEREFDGTNKAYANDVIRLLGFVGEEDRKSVVLVAGGYSYLDAAEIGSRALASVVGLSLDGDGARNYVLTTFNSQWSIKQASSVNCSMAAACRSENSQNIKEYVAPSIDFVGAVSANAIDLLSKERFEIATKQTKFYDSLFGRLNDKSLPFSPEERHALQSYVSKRSRFWATEAYRDKRHVVGPGISKAISFGVLPVLQSALVQFRVREELELIVQEFPFLVDKIPDTVWVDFLKDSVEGIGVAIGSEGVSHVTTKSIIKMLGIKNVAATVSRIVGGGVGVGVGVITSPDQLGEDYTASMPANTEAATAWAISNAALSESIEEHCGDSFACIESESKFVGQWEYTKIKRDYFKLMGLDTNKYDWVDKYEVSKIGFYLVYK